MLSRRNQEFILSGYDRKLIHFEMIAMPIKSISNFQLGIRHKEEVGKWEVGSDHNSFQAQGGVLNKLKQF